MEKLNKKCIKLIYTSLLLFFLMTFIKAEDINWVTFNEANHSAIYTHISGAKEQIIGLEFNSINISPYMKITLTPDEITPTPLLCFSEEDSSCNKGRQILSKRTDGLSSMIFIRREQIQSGKLYLLVTCEESGCGYTIKYEDSEYAEIDADSVFSYLVTKYNREMTFQVMGVAEEGSFLTIGVEGSSKMTMSFEDISISPINFDGGEIITFPIVNTNSNSLTSFRIRGAEIGEFLTVSIHVVYDNKAKDNLLYPNGPTIMGMLYDDDNFYKEECFPISAFVSDKYSNVNKYYLTGRILSKYALFWLADENGYYMEETDIEIKDGLLSYMIETNGLKRSVCFEFSYEEEISMYYVAYSISILEVKKMESIYNFYFPQIMGQNYRRMIPKGSYAVYHPGHFDQNDKRLNYYMYNRKGVAEMYTYKCLSYPNCSYTIEEIEKFNNPKKTNKMTVYDIEIEKEYNALDPEKEVMIVYCKDDDNKNNGYCEVDVSFNIPGNSILLVEDEQLFKYVLKDEKGKIIIDLKNGIKIQRLTIDIMIYSGDITFNINNSDDKLDINKYYLSNKIVFSLNLAQSRIDRIEVEYNAILNSFFTIKYSNYSYNLEELEEKILSGENYLVEIDPNTYKKRKTVYLSNYRTKKGQAFLVNFYALNCKFEVTKKDSTTINFYDNYAQEILYKDTEGYNSEYYQYMITILETIDLSNYNHKMCMLYVTGYESPDTESITEILVGENIRQKVIVNKNFKSIRFLYPHQEPSKNLTIYINMIHPAYYNIKIYINNDNNPFKQFTITRSEIIYLPGKEILNNCNVDNLCNIIFEVEFIKNISYVTFTEQPEIEITIRPTINSASYLQKNYDAKKDFLCGNRFYYLYADIGKNDIGEVLVNSLRGYCNVWGKIVRKDQTYRDEEANWRGIYRMPSAQWEDSLYYNKYTKKLEIRYGDTIDCIEGCYLLLSIQISQNGQYVDDYKFYPFSIITRITGINQAYTDIPKIIIRVNEYIIGNIDVATNERISEFYEVWLPHDSDSVDFDFQSEVSGLYINVGGTRPTTKNADFKLLPPGRDSVLSLDKYSILQTARSKKINIPNINSLEGVNLVIGYGLIKQIQLIQNYFL